MTPLAPAVLFLALNHGAVQLAEGADRDPPPASAAREAAANRARDIQDRWNLRLLPEKCPEIDPALLDAAWGERMPHDILGRGIDRFIRFPAARGAHDGRSIAFTTVRHHGVHARVRETTTTATHPLTLGGPFLEYDGLLHTAFVSREVLVPDAILEVADRKWYTAAAQRTSPSQAGEVEVTLTEYLFEFDDDPIAAARGTLTLHRHVRKPNEPAGKMTHFSAIFVRFRHERDERAPYELQIGTPEQRSLTAWFYSGRPYALLPDRQTAWTGIYRPEKAAP
jgi:hypothetical protein